MGRSFTPYVSLIFEELLNEYYEKANSTNVDISESVMMNMMQSTNPMNDPRMIALTMINQVIETQSGAKLSQVKEMENEIQLQMKSIETQLAAAQAELKTVEETERKNIDSSAPKFA